MSDYELILAFDSDDPEFVRGFEAGRLYGLAQVAGELPDGFTFHAANMEMVLRVAESLGLKARAEELDDDWMVLVGEARGA